MRLSEVFFNEIVSHPVPLDMNTLKALKRSSLGLDLYLWLTYRIFALTTPQRLTWRHLYRQFGVDPEKASDKRTVQNFRSRTVYELAKIKLAWPELNYTTAPGVLILHPSAPAIAPQACVIRGSFPRDYRTPLQVVRTNNKEQVVGATSLWIN